MRLTTLLLFISATDWPQERFLRIEKILPDGKKTAREIQNLDTKTALKESMPTYKVCK